MKFIFRAALFASATLSIAAQAKICNPTKEKCWLKGGGSSSSPAYPSRNAAIKINPTAVPTAKSWGGELLYYESVDFAIVKGTGRIGAAISPSNGEETFFGGLGFEEEDVRLERLRDGKKFKSEKYALAAAFDLYSNRGSGLKKMGLTLGLLGKYNSATKSILPGAGLSAALGPLAVGYAAAMDDRLSATPSPLTGEREKLKYNTETMSAGINLSSVVIDYSHMRIHLEEEREFATISLLTGSLLLNRWILTLAARRESSPRLAYNFDTKEYEEKLDKDETFGGVQFAPTKVLLLGIFHNYYLMREVSLGATLFF